MDINKLLNFKNQLHSLYNAEEEITQYMKTITIDSCQTNGLTYQNLCSLVLWRYKRNVADSLKFRFSISLLKKRIVSADIAIFSGNE